MSAPPLPAAASDADPLRAALIAWLGLRWQPQTLPALRQRLSHPPFTRPQGGDDLAGWQALYDLAAQERVAGLLYDVARNQGLCPPAIERQLHDFAAYTAVQNRGRLAALAAALDHLAAVGVAVILLKGAALAENLYANLALRPMVDLDLLVRRAAAAPALQHLTTAGYRAIDYGPHMLSTLTFENEIMLIEPGPQAGMLELHWSLFDSPHHQARLPEDWLWQTAQPAPAAGRRALILGNEAQLLHLCGHLALHHAGQSDLLWLHDVAELLQQTAQTLDWELVLAQAQACDLVLSLRQTLARVVAMWQAPAPEGALARLAALPASPGEKALIAARAGGPQSTLQRFWADLVAQPGANARFRYAWQNIFPTPAYMRRRYQIRRPFLLPLAYPYRWGVGLAARICLRK